MENQVKGWNAVRRESFARLIFYRGFLQFGIGATVLFIAVSAFLGDDNLLEHGLRAAIAFPLFGLIFGAMLWAFGRIFGRNGSEQTTKKT